MKSYSEHYRQKFMLIYRFSRIVEKNEKVQGNNELRLKDRT